MRKWLFVMLPLLCPLMTIDACTDVLVEHITGKCDRFLFIHPWTQFYQMVLEDFTIDGEVLNFE